MNFSGLKRLIESADQQAFYDVALLLLDHLGYRDLHIVDGPYDGGRDVASNREHVQIQLSVRRDWEKKILEESRRAIEHGKSHLLFVTNRNITPTAEASFRRRFPEKDNIELTIYDSSRTATNLSAPGRIAKSYNLLGVEIKVSNKFKIADIAASMVLLFGDEAIELREKTIDSVVISWLRENRGADEKRLVANVSELLPGANPPRLVASSVSRLRARGAITGAAEAMELSDTEKLKVDSAVSELSAAREADIQTISHSFELPREQSEELLDIVIEFMLRSNRAGWTSAVGDDLRGFLVEHGLSKRSDELNSLMSTLTTVTKYEYIGTIDRVFSTNTFDVFRSLGGKTDIIIVLDTSVALPLMFSLEFGSNISGYSTASFGMNRVAFNHGFGLFVPRPYLNEMASHGQKALDFSEVYDALEPELRWMMRSSRNAYVSHYASISERQRLAGDKFLSFAEFLDHFGIRRGATLSKIERVIQGILETHQISIGWNNRYDFAIRDEIADKKQNYPDIVINHDAAVCTHLREDSSGGYIFATWDKVLIELLAGGLSIYADNPGRIVDWLSYAQGIESGLDGSLEVMSALAIVEEAAAARVADKLLKIREADQAYKLNDIIREARSKTRDGALSDDEVEHLVDVELDNLLPVNDNASETSGSTVPEG